MLFFNTSFIYKVKLLNFMRLSFKKNRTRAENLFLKEIVKSTFFIGFAFANYFLPFFICLMAGVVKNPLKPEYIVGIGLSTSYLVVIFQLGSILAMSLSFSNIIYQKHKGFRALNKDQINTFHLVIVFVSGIVLVPIYIGFAYLYMYFCGAFSNTRQAVCEFGLNFLLSSSPSILFMTINTFLIYKIFFEKRQNLQAIIVVFINLFINCFCSAFIGIYVDWINTYSFGIGISIGSVVCLFVNVLILLSKGLLWKLKFTLHIKDYISTFKTIWTVAFVNLYITFLKSIMVLAVGLSLKVQSKYTPWDYLLSKIVWYNAIYLLGFFNNGLTQQLGYIAINNYDRVPKLYGDAYKYALLLPIFTIIFTIALVVAFGYCVTPISNLYASHADPSLGVVGSGPMPTPDEIAHGKPIPITCFLLTPYNRTYLWTAVFIVLIALSTSLGALTPIKVVNKTKKETRKENLTTIISATLVLIFIIAFGCGIQSPHFQGMEIFSCGLIIISCVFCVMKLLGFLVALKKNKYLYKLNINQLPQPKVCSKQWDASEAINQVKELE